MRSKIFLFFVSVSILFSFSAAASVTVGSVVAGQPGYDTVRIYVVLINCTDTDRVGWVRYGNGYVNITPNQNIQLGNSQLEFLLSGLPIGSAVPFKFCHWRPGENIFCTPGDTVMTTLPPCVTTVDLINGAMTDSGLVVTLDLNSTCPVVMQPFWDIGMNIGPSPQYGNVKNFPATSGTETKQFLVLNWFVPDTYSVAMRFQNDSLLQLGQWGYSDTLPPMILSGIAEIGPLADIFIPTLAGNLLTVDLREMKGSFALLDMQGRIVRLIEFAGRTEIDVGQFPPGLYAWRLITEKGYAKTGKLLITR